MIKTINSIIKPMWAVYACNDNEVFYLIQNKNKKLVWKTIDEIHDEKNMVVCDTKDQILALSKNLKDKNNIPKTAKQFEFVKGFITFEDRKFWLDQESDKSFFYKEI